MFHVIAGISLVALAFLPKAAGKNLEGRRTVKFGIGIDENVFTDFSNSFNPFIQLFLHFEETALTMIGKYGITASLAILVLYAGEIYPTTLRNEGLGLASTAGRIGGHGSTICSIFGKFNQKHIYVKNNLKFID